ncbi:fibroin heavy chain isoform X3 [Dicentrarchus labrax]|uniref:fibroin heavy chain isoform X3 n=1 Tax=Dicentrarchus labrax TaxID=13489 RepID=UPI0021F68DF6|nr:fibroin heavy chain isoform X3 [Dicentrarchus labrax]
MLAPALLQTSLVLWLAQQTLQGGVKPQTMSWGRVLPARGVGIGVKPGAAGALGALGSRYGSKAMKTGIGRYPGVGGYRALGLGGRAGLKPGGYGTQGAYGASLGTGMGLGTGYTNGLGLNLGQGGKRVYGAGHGTLPGYGAVAGIGYPGARPGMGLGYHTGQRAKEQKPGVSTADLGGPKMANLGQAVQDLKREKSRALGPSYGKRDRTLGPEIPSMRRTNVHGLSAPELQAETGFISLLPPGREVKSLDPVVRASSLGPLTPLDKQTKGLVVSQAQEGQSYEPMILERRGVASHRATLATAQQLPLDKDNIRSLGSASSQVQSARHYDSSSQQNQRTRNCGSSDSDLSRLLEINRHELLGSETQRRQSSVPQLHDDKDSKYLGQAAPQAQEERTYRLPLSQTPDTRSNIFSLPLSQGTRNYFSAVAEGQGVKDLGPVATDANGPGIRGTVSVENHSRSSVNLQVQGGGRPLIPGASGTQSLGSTAVEGQEAKGFTDDGQEAKHLSNAEREVTKSKSLSIPGQTGRNTQATSYTGGAGNYLGANLGAGGYGAGLGQGAYLGGAAGKHAAAAAAAAAAAGLGQGGYPQGAAGISTGYGEGATGHLGAMAGNGYGYGNGYSNGHGAGLGYPSELAEVAENKAGKHEALSTGGQYGQVQGAYGALGTGLDSTGGKYGGAAQVPYGDGGYPYGTQHLGLGAEGAKTLNKYGAQQTGYVAQLGTTQDGFGEQAGKYGGVNGALGNGYKG